MLESLKLFLREPGNLAAAGAGWALSAGALALPGLAPSLMAWWALVLSAVLGVLVARWVLADVEQGLLRRSQVTEAGPAGARTARLRTGAGLAIVTSLAIVIGHVVLAWLALVGENRQAAIELLPLAPVSALAGYGFGLLLGHIASPRVAPLIGGFTILGGALGYAVTGQQGLLAPPPGFLLASIHPPTGIAPWAWGAFWPYLQAGIAAGAGFAVARLALPNKAHTVPALLAVVLLIPLTLLAPSPLLAEEEARGLETRGVWIIEADARPELVRRIEASDTFPPVPANLVESLALWRDEPVLLMMVGVPGTLPNATGQLRWDRGAVLLEARQGFWEFPLSGNGTRLDVGLYRGQATITSLTTYNEMAQFAAPETNDHGPVSYEAHVPAHTWVALLASLPGGAVVAAAAVWRRR